ncbi:MAG: DUF11 domain-containing protein [Dehalococcoidia bacterium]
MRYGSSTGRRAQRGIALAALAALAVWLAGALAPASVPVVHAAAFVVNDLGDAVDAAPGNGVCATAGAVCTLRAAIQEANASAGPDTITLPLGQITLTLLGRGEDGATTGDLDINGDLTITGPGAPGSRVFAGGIDRVFHVRNGAKVTMSGFLVSGGNATLAGENGGGILVDAGSELTLTNVWVGNGAAFRNDVGNATGAGGGVANLGKLTLNQSRVQDNRTLQGGGGGLFNGLGATLTMVGGVINGNRCFGVDCESQVAPITGGGGLFNAGTATLTNVTINANGDPAAPPLDNQFGSGILNTGTLTLTGGAVTNNVSDGAPGGGIANVGTLRALGTTVSGNNTGDADNDGGGLFNGNGGNAQLTRVTVTNNRAGQHGGGIANTVLGTLLLASSTVSNNRADDDDNGTGNGGGIWNRGAMVVTTTSVSGNRSGSDDGGGIFSGTGSTLTVITSTISGNTAGQNSGDHGGGLFLNVDVGKVHKIVNSTISGNTAFDRGGGIYKQDDGRVDLINVTIFNNAAASGPNIRTQGGDIRAFNTIISDAAGAASGCVTASGGTITDLGGNLVASACGAIAATVANPQLAPLANNGGPTQTHRPLLGSPAIDTGLAASVVDATVVCPGQDQRGVARPQDGVAGPPVVCDKGAVEVAALAPAPPPTSADLSVTKVDVTDPFVAGSGDLVYIITVTNLGPATATGVAVRDTLPAGWTFVRGQFLTGAGALGACSRVTVAAPVNCVIGTVGPNTSTSIYLTVTPVAGVAPQVNTAVVSNTSQADPTTTNNTATETTQVN